MTQEAASIGIIVANWFLLLAGGGVFGLLATRTRIEEANLVARFGDDYRVYMRRTGRFLPKIGSGRVT
jgi:protein-S-isoprenylcysteine O-methyltransferase Ste14